MGRKTVIFTFWQNKKNLNLGFITHVANFTCCSI